MEIRTRVEPAEREQKGAADPRTMCNARVGIENKDLEPGEERAVDQPKLEVEKGGCTYIVNLPVGRRG